LEYHTLMLSLSATPSSISQFEASEEADTVVAPVEQPKQSSMMPGGKSFIMLLVEARRSECH
jgi:hypothetical protein